MKMDAQGQNRSFRVRLDAGLSRSKLLVCQILILANLMLIADQSFAAPQPTTTLTGDSVTNGTVTNEKVLSEKQKVSHNMKHHPHYNLTQKICKNHKVDIPDLKLMRSIVTIVQLDDRSCNERYDNSIRALDPILRVESENLCSEDSIEMLKKYHFRFIQPLRHLNIYPTKDKPVPQGVYKAQLHPEPRKYTADYEETTILMTPIAIRHFFLKFALQVSFTCKRNLVANLAEEDQLQLSEEDKALMSKFRLNTPLGQAFSADKAVDFDNVMFILELDGPGSKLNPERGEKFDFIKVHMGVESDSFKLIAGCRNKFAPIYNKLFLPVIKLSKMGYDYRGDKFNDFEYLTLNKGKIRTWISIIHVCQLFSRVKLYDASGFVLPTTIDDHATPTAPNTENDNPKDDVSTQPVPLLEGESANLDNEMDSPSDSISEMLDPDSRRLKVEQISQQEAQDLQSKFKQIDLMRPIHYQMTVSMPFEEELMISSEKQLDLELSLKPGHKNPFGFSGFMRNTGSLIKKGFAKLDMDRFAHYRRHSVYYAGLLNFLSALSNVASITTTILGIVGVPVG